MKSCSFTLIIFSAVIFLRCLRSTGAASCHPDDEAGLLAFKSGITQDPSGILSSWKKGTNCCSWKGVTCVTGGRVTGLEVSGHSNAGEKGTFLHGTISPSLAKLQHLNEIYLTDLRKISGSFPQFLFRLPKLKNVYIRNNLLSGPLPSNIGALSQLGDLDLDGNQFTGSIPSSISNMTRLSRLILGGNRLSGTIPDVFKSMKELTYLDLSRNRFSGKLPPSIALLKPTLWALIVGQNNLSGTIPDYLLRFELIILDLSKNRLSGPLPTNIGVLNQLEYLDLAGNQFTGSIPSSISNMTRLARLNLGGNRLFGTIPDIFKYMMELKYLDLSCNGFSGKLPPSIESLEPTLWALKLGQNNLSGTIPDYLSRFEFLSILDLSRNRFSGVVPKSFAKLTKLFDLNLSHNLLIDLFPTMDVRSMESLDLSYNQFRMKTIPKWVTVLTNINSLKLAKCGIKMRLDDWKPVAPLKYVYIDLSENEISGSPERFLNQTKYLLEFRAAGNKLRFDMGKLTFAKTLKTLDLSRNLVFGKVLARVAGLQKLNVSQNHLCGKLPATKFPAIAFASNDCLCGSPLSPCIVR